MIERCLIKWWFIASTASKMDIIVKIAIEIIAKSIVFNVCLLPMRIDDTTLKCEIEL